MTLRSGYRSEYGFTLIEAMISLLLFVSIVIMAFDAVGKMSFSRLMTLNKINLESELYFFSEKLTTLIKESGTIDYEEYWNRKVVGTQTASGHYLRLTGLGNYGSGGVIGTTQYGSGWYYCRSSATVNMGTGGCLNSLNTPSLAGGASRDYTGQPQRYGEYALQFTDYNADVNADLGDADGDGNIKGDEDDAKIGDGPILFSGESSELYLYDTMRNERTFFRMTVRQDPDAPPGATCDVTNATGSGCLGNIEILKMSGRDYGLTHSGASSTDMTAYDGQIDTWVCHTDWKDVCNGPTVGGGVERLATGTGGEWIPLFPSSINLKNISFRLYPQKDPSGAWASTDPSVLVHPYVRLQFTLGLSWGDRLAIKGSDPTIVIDTSVSLSEF